MNKNVNYTAIGVSVLIGFVMMFAFAYWLLQPSDEQEVETYAILFDESVLGLNLDAPVKYRGIDVGKVTRMRINPKNSEQIEVLISVYATTPVKSSTVAKLTSQGITGLSYINLTLGDNSAPKLEPKEGEEYAVIQTAPSFFERFEQSLDSVSSKLSKTLTKSEEVLNETNQREFALLLHRSASAMGQLEKMLSDDAIADTHQTLQNLKITTQKLDAMLPQVESFVAKSIVWEDKISGSMQGIQTTYLGIGKSMDEIKRAVASGEFNAKAITSDVIPTMNSTFLDMQRVIFRLEEVLNAHQRSPSDILYKQESVKKGPGE